MIEEIVYTSAQKGLKPGSRGFCTVVSTAGMAINTAERLESMSGYRHAFPMQDSRAAWNPVNFAHVTLRIGSKNAHVISRVADAGQDYSGRTNKLAHHLMIDDVSRFAAGPARLLAETGVLVSQWDGNARNVPPRNLPVPTIPKTIELKAWQLATGDSGWGGWVAEQLMTDKSPVSVIFAPGTDTLALVREVLDLLPPTQRWSVTFSTYFTKMLAGTECQLRFVLDDTPEATALRNDARAKVVDLMAALKPATGGAIVAQARSGRVVATESPPPVQRPATTGRPSAPTRVSQPQVETETIADLPALRSTMPDAPVFSSPSLPPALANPFDAGKRAKKRSSGTWKYVVGAILLVASSSLITVFVVKYMNQRPGGGAKVEDSKKSTAPQVAANNPSQAAKAATADPASGLEPKKPSPARPSDPESKSPEVPSNSKDTGSPGIAEAVADSTQKSTTTEQPQSRKEDVFEPFRLVMNDDRFKYPNHPDLLLFELPRKGANNPRPSMPLLMREGDTLQLNLHASFKHLINLRTDHGTKGPDIRITASDLNAPQREWNAELFLEGKSVFPFGEYSLKAGTKTNSIENDTLSLEFTPGVLCDTRNPTEEAYANLFRYCPIVVSVHRENQPVIPKVFCQTRGQTHKSEAGDGVRWSPEFDASFNPFEHFAILRAKKESRWKMAFEIVTLASPAVRTVRNVRFDDVSRNKISAIQFSATESGDAMSPMVPDATLCMDNQNGCVEYQFEWEFTKNKTSSGDVPSEYFVTKRRIAVYKLPQMILENGDHVLGSDLPYRERFNNPTDKLDKDSWKSGVSATLGFQERLRLSSVDDKLLDKNFDQLKQSVKVAQNSLEDAKTDKEHEIEKITKDQSKKDLQDEIETLDREIKEIDGRISAVSELINAYTEVEHRRQLNEYKAFLNKDKERYIGYEISIELDAYKDGEIDVPAAKFYLIETQFPGEK